MSLSGRIKSDTAGIHFGEEVRIRFLFGRRWSGFAANAATRTGPN